MARPRQFDEDTVLERAQALFWERGYDATSIDDLVSATGVGRASLYGAFGDKEHLFRRVLARYLDNDQRHIAASTRNLAGEAAIRAFFAQRVAKFCPRDGIPGCFMQVSGLSGSAANLVQETTSDAARNMRRWLQGELKVAQRDGAVDAAADPNALADYLIVLNNGLSASARGGLGAKVLKAAAREGLDRVFAKKKAV